MSASEHLQIINPSYTDGKAVMFHLFPKLLTELRLQVWHFSIEQHRLLEVEINHPRVSEDSPLYSTTNRLNKLISGRKYVASVQGCQVYSKLLRINRESRQVALRFYRIHIPCYFRTSKRISDCRTEKTVASILYLNPEYDFMSLRTPGGVRPKHPSEHELVDFLHDLKAYDPMDIGLLNLALDTNGMTVLHSITSISEAPAKASFISFLQQLQEIIWVAESISGRAIIGPLQNFQGVGVRFNHSMPIKAITPTFDLLRRDPRAIEPDLKFVLTACSDPRHMRVQWRQVLERWDIRQASATKERALFTYELPEHEQQVYNIETAKEFLREEEKEWLSAQKKWHRIVMKHAGKVPVESPEELAKVVRSAIGFWLFPAESLGSLEGIDGVVSGMKIVFDMTGYWPELALSALS